jgi:hypothetical protein
MYLLYYTFIIILNVLFLLRKKVNYRTASGSSFKKDPEDPTVIVRGHSSMCVTVPEDFPLGQDVEVENSGTDDL